MGPPYTRRLDSASEEGGLAPLGDEETEAQAAGKHPGLCEMFRIANPQGQEVE